MAIVKTTILDDESNEIREVLNLTDAKKASLSIEGPKLTITISSADWFAWLATLPPSGASVAAQVAEPDSGKIVHTIADIRWPTWWPRD